MNKQAAASGRICQVSKSKFIKKLHPLQFPLLKAKVFFTVVVFFFNLLRKFLKCQHKF